MATLRVLEQPEWNEIRTAAQELKGLGGDAARVLRRAIREAAEPEPEPEPEPANRATAILGALEWLAKPETKRACRPPELTPLSEVEAEAIRTTIDATDMGIDVSYSLGMDTLAEDVIRSDADREAGRLAKIDDARVLDLLRETPVALDSWRVRDRFRDWISKCSDREALAALRELRKGGKYGNREFLGTAVLERLDFLREAGFLEAEAVRHVAKQGCPYFMQDEGSTVDMLVVPKGSSPMPPMTVGLVRSLLRDGKRAMLIPRKLTPHKRPGRSKPKTP